jgi:hypothetical protein
MLSSSPVHSDQLYQMNPPLPWRIPTREYRYDTVISPSKFANQSDWKRAEVCAASGCGLFYKRWREASFRDPKAIGSSRECESKPKAPTIFRGRLLATTDALSTARTFLRFADGIAPTVLRIRILAGSWSDISVVSNASMLEGTSRHASQTCPNRREDGHRRAHAGSIRAVCEHALD